MSANGWLCWFARIRFVLIFFSLVVCTPEVEDGINVQCIFVVQSGAAHVYRAVQCIFKQQFKRVLVSVKGSSRMIIARACDDNGTTWDSVH